MQHVSLYAALWKFINKHEPNKHYIPFVERARS